MSDLLFSQGRTVFFLPNEHEKDALEALKAAARKHSFPGDISSAKTLGEGLSTLGWLIHRDADGNIDGIRADDLFGGREREELRAIAKFVHAGSSMVLRHVAGDSGRAVVLVFDGKKLLSRPLDRKEKSDPQTFEAPDFEPTVEEAATPEWKDVQRSMPKERPEYRPTIALGSGDWLEHPKFGAGLVLATIDRQKARVLFAEGERVLAHSQF